MFIVCHRLDITVMSAEGLKDVHRISKMKAYVEVSVHGHESTTRRTRADENGGGINPTWNDSVSFMIDAAAINSLNLVFHIKSKRTFDVAEVGWVSIPLKKLFGPSDAAEEQQVVCPVLRPSGETKGSLRFSYKFGEMVAVRAITAGEIGSANPAHVGANITHPSPLPAMGGLIMFVSGVISFVNTLGGGG